MNKPIELFAVHEEPFTDKELDHIVNAAIAAGYVPLNAVPRSIRGKQPYLTFHFIARTADES